MRYLLTLILLFNHIFGIDAKLTIEKDVPSRATIAVINENSKTGSISDVKMFELIKDDIKISGHFNLSNKEFNSLDIYDDNIEYILKYSYSSNRISAKLIEISSNNIIFQKNYMVNTKSRYPFLAHNVVADINSALGYEDISWIKRYIIFSKYTSSRKAEIWIADYTLTFASVIIRGGLNLFPIWANSNQSKFYYTSYNNRVPTLYIVDMQDGNREKIISSEGMLVCSDVSRDAKRLLLTMAPNGQPDIYEYSLDSKDLNQITKFSGIDVNGKYVGDESKIVFVSDRTGKANIYLKSIGSSAVSKVAIYGSNNSSCDAFDRYIIYSVKESGNTNIYLGSLYDSYVRPLTDSGVNIFPRFSQNGRVVLYIKQRGDNNSIEYINLSTKESKLYPMVNGQIQSIDW